MAKADGDDRLTPELWRKIKRLHREMDWQDASVRSRAIRVLHTRGRRDATTMTQLRNSITSPGARPRSGSAERAC